jgi:tRNA pseudouridine55 synthase
MNGILVIDKPAGITSHDVVARVRRILKTKRVGHTGTLDPFATGVMTVLVGNATRLARFLDKDIKEYEATLLFGFETDTGDVTGTPKADVSDPKKVSLAHLKGILKEFQGDIQQTPPMYSAKKVAGKKLYELARKGLEVERKPVKVSIYRLEMVQAGRSDELVSAANIRVECSAGTYIRTLAEDIGRKMGTGAHLTALRRTRSGKFDLTHSITLDELKKLKDPLLALLPVSEAVEHMPSIVLSADRVTKTRSGLSTRIVDAKFQDGEPVRMHDEAGDLVAIGFYDPAENAIQPKIVLV